MSKYDKLWNYINIQRSDNLTLSFDEIEIIAGTSIDHSFLNYKAELTQYGYEVHKISMKNRQVSFTKTYANVNLVLYIHGKGGSFVEAEHYKNLFKGCDVIGLDYYAETMQQAKEEFPTLFKTYTQKYNHITIIANSIGAYFAMCALPQEKIKRAYFISPIVDMERLILNMMDFYGLSEDNLQKQETIHLPNGEALSWQYLCYTRNNPIIWNVPSCILYGENDNLTSLDTITSFANQTNANLTIMPNGEHWFHTDNQMKFLDEWIRKNTNE